MHDEEAVRAGASARTSAWCNVLRRIAPHARADIVDGFSNALPELCRVFRIDTSLRKAHFLAQCAHESAGLTAVVEIGQVSYFRRYDARKDLGNTEAGDGARFRGRGLIQLTGRRNYQHFGALLGVDLVVHPEKAATFPIAAQTAAFYWRDHALNAVADRDDLESVTRAINGGLNGLTNRRGFFARAKAALAQLDVQFKATPNASTT